ncbi:MAG: DUF4214 domain-containing protein, partial [Clostridiales bacterium]|nr:DUF4214 domain-containing protein [Clostridiales bacterium]
MRRFVGITAAILIVVCSFFVPVTADDYEIPISDTYFRDEAFREYVKRFDKDDSKGLSDEECKAVVKINLYSSAVTDLDGIESFPDLEELNISFTNIEGAIDLRCNEKLRKVVCKGSSISEIKFCEGVDLDLLDISYTENFIELDLSDSYAHIEKMNCEGSNVKEIYDCYRVLSKVDVDDCTQLRYLRIGDLEELSCDKCTSLAYLCISGGANCDLNLNPCTNLTTFICYDRDNFAYGKHTIYASGLTHLNTFIVEGDMVLPDLTSNKNLSELSISYNENLEKYDLSTFSKLNMVIFLDCKNLQTVKFPQDNKITYLNIKKTGIKTLELKDFPKLERLDISGTSISEIDLTKTGKIQSVDISYCPNLSKIVTTDLSELKEFFALNSKISSFDFSGCPNLETVFVPCSEDTQQELIIYDSTKLKEYINNGWVYKKYAISSNPDGNKYTLVGRRNDPLWQNWDSIPVYMEGYPAAIWCGLNAKIVTENPNKPAEPDNQSNTNTPSTPTSTPSTPTNPSTPSAPSTAQQGLSFGDFVERLYVVALNRQSEPEGKAFWCEHVGNGDLNGAQCANEFLLSKEFNDRGLSDEEFLKVLYKTFFDRDAANDSDGFNFWMNSLKTEGRDKVVDGFINSEEWCNICASYGVKSGATRAKATIASANATAFATRLYTECLGREPEAEGLKFWSLGLTNLELSGTQAAREFFYSPEFVNANYSDEEYINRMYKTFMGRDPE